MHIANTHKRRHVRLVWLSREWISKEENSFDWAAATVVAVPVYVKAENRWSYRNAKKGMSKWDLRQRARVASQVVSDTLFVRQWRRRSIFEVDPMR